MNKKDNQVETKSWEAESWSIYNKMERQYSEDYESAVDEQNSR